MVTLTKKEQYLRELLERRLAKLSARTRDGTVTFREFESREHHALLWALEMVEAAVAADCDEVFAYTRLRSGSDTISEIKQRRHEETMAAQRAAKAKQKAERQAANRQRMLAEKAAAAQRRAERQAAHAERVRAQAAAAELRRQERRSRRYQEVG